MMKHALTVLALFAAVAPAAAQTDTIHLTDGSVIDRVRMTGYNFQKLTYKKGALEESVPRERVFKVELGQRRVTSELEGAKKALTDENFATAYQQYLEAAEKLGGTKGFEHYAQFAYWEAFQLAKKIGTEKDRADVLGSLEKTDSAFWPDIWRYRLEKARNEAGNVRQKLEGYRDLVKQFEAFVAEKGLSERYQIEASLYEIDARGLLREFDAKRVQEELGRLQPRVEGRYPDLANRINLEFANAVMVDGKVDEARRLYTDITDSKVADDVTKARAFLGRGHTWFKKESRTPEDGKQALYDYMRVAILFPESDIEVVGEALYHAISAYRLWNGPEAEANIRRLRGRLKIKYADSSWANK